MSEILSFSWRVLNGTFSPKNVPSLLVIFFSKSCLAHTSQTLGFERCFLVFKQQNFSPSLRVKSLEGPAVPVLKKNDTSILKQKCLVLHKKDHPGIYFFWWHLFSSSKWPQIKPSPSLSFSALGKLFTSFKCLGPSASQPASQPGKSPPYGLSLGDNIQVSASKPIYFLHHLAFIHIWLSGSFLLGLGDLIAALSACYQEKLLCGS